MKKLTLRFTKRDDALELIEAEPDDIPDARKRIIIDYELSTKQHCYYVSAFDPFVKVIKSIAPHNRRFHENIHPDKICKLYMDCESKRLASPPTYDMLLEYANTVQAKVVDLVANKYSMNALIDPPLVLTASDEHKISLHLVWSSIGFNTPKHCKRFVQQLNIAKLNEISVDFQVYPCGSGIRTMRMPYNVKAHDTRYLIPLRSKLLDEPMVFDERYFCQGLITIFNTSSEKHKFLSPPPLIVPVTFDVVLNKRLHLLPQPQTCSNPEDPSAVSMLMVEWMSRVYPNFFYEGVKVNDVNNSFHFLCKIWCPFARRVHQSNKMYVKSSINGGLALICPDIECRASRHFQFTSGILMKSKQKLTMDESLLPKSLH